MKKKFIDKWWVRIVALLVIPGLLGGGSSTVSSVLFLVLLILILVRVSKDRKSSKSDAKESASESLNSRAPMPADGTYIVIKSSGNFSTDIAGESHYFDVISRATHRRIGHHLMLAEIIREPENKFDPNAVRVEIDSRTVGYIPRKEAPSFHPLLNYAESINKRIFVSCRVWVSDKNESFASVSLDIDDPNSSLHQLKRRQMMS